MSLKPDLDELFIVKTSSNASVEFESVAGVCGGAWVDNSRVSILVRNLRYPFEGRMEYWVQSRAMRGSLMWT